MIRRVVGRLLLVPLGIVLASAVAFFVISSIGLERITQEAHRTGDITGAGGVVWSIFRNWGTAERLLSGLTVAPVLLLLVVGEVARLRSAMYYVVGGGAALGIMPLLANIDRGNLLWQVFATGGFAAGYVYWLIAGRTA